jgi:branched-subunit amino acid transport protein
MSDYERDVRLTRFLDRVIPFLCVAALTALAIYQLNKPIME